MNICNIPGCNKEAKVAKMCNAHYIHMRRYGTPYTHTLKAGFAKEHKKEYDSYRSMKNRCLCKTDKNYPRWGGAGITICDRWLGKDGFVNFYKDMGDRPDKTTLDRIDNAKGYSPDNCRWADAWTQVANTRRMTGRIPGVYYIKSKGRWCANFNMGSIRLTKSCATKEDAISQRREWENEFLSVRSRRSTIV